MSKRAGAALLAAFSNYPIVRGRWIEPRFCPFCGGTCGVYGDVGVLVAHVYCARCWARGPDFTGRTPRAAARKAAKHWNRRAKGPTKAPPDSRPHGPPERDVQ